MGTKTLMRALALILALAAPAVAAPQATAAEAPGVYDIAIPHGAIQPSGTATFTWRAVIPAGTSTDGYANCHLSVDGVEKAVVACRSGEPFSYDLGSGIAKTALGVEVDQFYADPANPALLFVVSGTATGWVDGVPPSASVTAFTLTDGATAAPNPMRPATAYKASMVWSDNLAVTSQDCAIERISPPPTVTVTGVSCGLGSSHGGSALFTTPSTSGTYNFVLVVEDPVGHTARATKSFVVDASPPALTFTAGPAEGSATNAEPVSWAWSADESATYACALVADGVTPVLTSCSSPYTVHDLAEGNYQLSVRATDTYANAGTTTIHFTVDRTKPTVVLTSPTSPDPVVPGVIHVAAQASEASTFLCSTDPDVITPVYETCSSAATTSYTGDYDGHQFGIHRIGIKAVDAAGNVSDPVVAYVTVAPPVTGSAKIAGSAQVGSKLVADGTWSAGASLTYQWRRDGADIPGATATTYVASVKDLGHQLSVRVVGTLSGYVPTTITSSAVKVAAGVLTSGRARIAGTMKVGKRLTASASPWAAGTTVRYQWYAGGRRIAGATKPQLSLTKKLVGKRIKVVITGSRAGYATRALSVTAKGTVRR